MNKITSQRRPARHSISHSRPLGQSRAVSPTRTVHPVRAATRDGGNGQSSASGSGPAISSEVRAWLTRPKHNLIGGKWVPAASGKFFEVFNPADASVIAQVPDSEREDINRAVAAARRAFDSGPWRRVTPSDRGRLVWRIGDLVLAHADELAELESLDNGKPRAVARVADVPLAADLFHYMAGWATKIQGSTFPISVPYAPGARFHAFTLREPLGVVGQIIPWNFPLLMAAWKLGPALATGNCVVLKPAEQTPLSALRLGELILEAGCRTASSISSPGSARPPEPRWPLHQDVDKIAFTGSTEVGKLIVHAAAGNLKKVRLELGGKSPNIVSRTPVTWRRHRRRGQRHFLQSRPVLLRRLAPAWWNRRLRRGGLRRRRAPENQAGPRSGPPTQMGPLVSEEQLQRVCGFLNQATRRR